VYPLGHVGITLLLGKWLSKRLNKKWNLRLIVLGSILPDLIDKPLGILGFGGGRFISHTLLFTLALVVKKELFFGSLVHLLLDRMWENPQILLFPILGFEVKGRVYLLDFIQFFLRSRYSQVGEAIGAACLVMSRKI